MTGNGYVEGDC